MLHQSPRSSRELLSLMERWSEFFTVVAPDSPGYGLSDPLCIADARLGDFADATIEFMNAIGAGRFGVYGFHTGGMIGIALAQGYPDRVAGFSSNGVAIPTDEELEDILVNYLPPFEPRWDGGHLAWLWAKTREQTIFFPWHNHTLAGRMDFPMPSPEQQQDGVLDFLNAGDHYSVGYRAAFTFHAEKVVPELKVPGLITATGLDPLLPHLARIVDAPDCVQVAGSDSPEAALEKSLALLLANTGDGLGKPPVTIPVPGRLWQQLVETVTGTVSLIRGGKDADVPVILLHDAGRSSASVACIAEGLTATHSVICIDLPGHGESDCDPEPGGPGIETCTKQVASVLDRLDLQSVDVIGVECGAFVAVDLASLHADRVGRIALIHPPVLGVEQTEAFHASGIPSFEPDWFGGHLLHCWHMVRDNRLYFPWFQRDQAGIHWQEPDLDEQRIQLEVYEHLKAEGAWQPLLLAQLQYPLTDKLEGCRDKVTLCAAPDSPWYAIVENEAARAGLPILDLSSDSGQWGAQLADVISR